MQPSKLNHDKERGEEKWLGCIAPLWRGGRCEEEGGKG